MANSDVDTIEVLSTHTFIIETPVAMDNARSNENLIDKKEEPMRSRRKFAARVVAVVSGLFIVLSCVLLGISFSMSKDIDEMVRNSNELLRKHESKTTSISESRNTGSQNILSDNINVTSS